MRAISCFFKNSLYSKRDKQENLFFPIISLVTEMLKELRYNDVLFIKNCLLICAGMCFPHILLYAKKLLGHTYSRKEIYMEIQIPRALIFNIVFRFPSHFKLAVSRNGKTS